MRRGAQAGFTLVELLITVAIIGLISAIAIPNLLNAVDRSRQQRTMADMRTIASAVETYSIDHTIYPTANTIVALKAIVEPIYLVNGPAEDGWSHEFVVDSTTVGYTLGSPGKDGGALNFVGGARGSLNDAIIFVNGQFWQWPEGTQQ